MEIKNRKDITPIKDACESLQEMYHSKNLSLSYATINPQAKPHKHLKMEEIYYIISGKGIIRIGDESFEIKSRDIIPIPKNKFHFVEYVKEPIELVVVTHPRFDPKDLIYQK
jgi:mannose-6-phosphate isomerase-like protein (cupin superfamily)